MCFSETNPWSTNSLLHAIQYSSFIPTKIVSLQANDEHSLSVLSKNRLTGETATKNRFAETTNNGQHTIRVSPSFHHFVGVPRYSQILYSGLQTGNSNMKYSVCRYSSYIFLSFSIIFHVPNFEYGKIQNERCSYLVFSKTGFLNFHFKCLYLTEFWT